MRGQEDEYKPSKNPNNSELNTGIESRTLYRMPAYGHHLVRVMRCCVDALLGREVPRLHLHVRRGRSEHVAVHGVPGKRQHRVCVTAFFQLRLLLFLFLAGDERLIGQGPAEDDVRVGFVNYIKIVTADIRNSNSLGH